MQGSKIRDCKAKVDHLITDTAAAWSRGTKAMRAAEQIATMGGPSKMAALGTELSAMTRKVCELEATVTQASSFLLDLNTYVSSLPRGPSPAFPAPTVSLKDFLALKKTVVRSMVSFATRDEGRGDGGGGNHL